MTKSLPKMTFHVEARRVDAHGSLSNCKNAENVKKYGTVFNTIAPGTDLSGVLRRRWTGPELRKALNV